MREWTFPDGKNASHVRAVIYLATAGGKCPRIRDAAASAAVIAFPSPVDAARDLS
jgi:hypothetical protein